MSPSSTPATAQLPPPPPRTKLEWRFGADTVRHLQPAPNPKAARAFLKLVLARGDYMVIGVSNEDLERYDDEYDLVYETSLDGLRSVAVVRAQ